MPTYTTSDLSRHSGDIIADALRKPVTITQRNKPRLVLMSVEDYGKLIRQGDPQRAHLARETPPEVDAIFATEIDRILGTGR